MTGIRHHRLTVNGADFHVAEAGAAGSPPVVLLHGFPEGWMSWRRVMGALADDYRLFAPDLRGYPSPDLGAPPARTGFGVFQLIDDVRALMAALGIERPALVGHDWGGALAWFVAHRHSDLIRSLTVVNCTHPRTLARAILHCDDWQTFRVPWLPAFQVPVLPEWAMTTPWGRRILRWSFTVREGRPGTMDRDLVDELVARFQRPEDAYGPIQYYRKIFADHVLPGRRRELFALYDRAIAVPITLIWGLEDGALSSKVARRSGADAGRELNWRPLPGVGHFVNLEAVEELVDELRRAMARRNPR